MDSLTASFVAGFVNSRVKGVASNPLLVSRLSTSALATSLASTGAGATLANRAFGPTSRSLAAGANEELDWTNFTSILGEAAQAFGTAIRLFYVIHSATSLASSITVGNASGNRWTPFSWPTATTLTFKPSEGIILIARTATGMPVDGTHKLFKALNNDGANAATYEISAIGS